MADRVVFLLTLAGVLSMLTMPGMVWALIGQASMMRRVMERNAVQAATIAALERSVREHGGVPTTRVGAGGQPERGVTWHDGERARFDPIGGPA